VRGNITRLTNTKVIEYGILRAALRKVRSERLSMTTNTIHKERTQADNESQVERPPASGTDELGRKVWKQHCRYKLQNQSQNVEKSRRGTSGKVCGSCCGRLAMFGLALVGSIHELH
jgi:hypothetical protein